MTKLNKLVVCASVVMISTMAFFVVISPKASAGTPVGGYIDSDTIWDIEGNPYWVESDVIVRNGANLSVVVGVDVLFNGSHSIYIEEGAMLWIKRAEYQFPYAIFTWNSDYGTPYPGRWRAIQFNDSSYDYSYIRYSLFEYATYGIRIESASPTIRDSIIRNCTYGIYSNYGSPTIENNTIENCTYNGIHIIGSDPGGGYANIKNNTIEKNDYGIYSDHSAPQIRKNKIVNNTEDGVHITGNNPSGGYANLENNTVYNNTKRGIVLYDVQNARLRNNNISSSSYNFGVWADALSEFNHDIDTTNTVNQKPIYYWRNHEHDGETIPSDAGYVGIVNSIGITAKNLTLTQNGQGVLVAYSDYTIIDNVSASDNEVGIILFSSSNNIIENSNISDNDYNGYYLRASGIYLNSSSNNNIIGNNVLSNNYNGIYIKSSSCLNITGNTCNSNKGHGIYLSLSSNNTISNNVCNSNKGFAPPLWHGSGIKLDFSSNNTLTNNTCNSNSVGNTLYYSSNNLLANNTCNLNTGLYSGVGMSIGWSSNNNIKNCKLSNNQRIGIELNSGSTNIITNCNSSNNENGINIQSFTSNSNIVTNCSIYNNNNYGIGLLGVSSATITYNDIKSNKLGVRSDVYSYPTIHNNTISGNTEYGVKHEGTSVSIHAEYNWWGDTDNSGPYDPSLGPPDYNPDGNGDKVSDYVYYDPWLAPP